MSEAVTHFQLVARSPGRIMARARHAGRTIFGQVLDRLESDAGTQFGFSHVHLRPVRYEERPFSHLLRVAVLSGGRTQPETHVFVKMLKTKPHDGGAEKMRQRVLHEFETTRRIHEVMRLDPSVGVVRPVACYPDSLTIVTEECGGDTLLGYLHQHATWFASLQSLDQACRTMSSIARWIAMLQTVDDRPGHISLDHVRDYVDHRLQRLVREPRARFSERDRENVLRHIDTLGSELSLDDLADVLVHADLAAGNIMVTEGRVVVLDMAMARRGSRLHDLTRLHMQLDLLRAKPQFRRSTIQALQSSLLRGFDPSLSVEKPGFRLSLLTHRVNNLATLSLRPAGFPASLYDAHVRRLHRAWIAHETRAAASIGSECR